MALKGREKQIVEERKKKIQELRDNGINPYPYTFDKKNSTKDIHKTYESLQNEETSKETVQTAGRIMTKRSMGKVILHQNNKTRIPTTQRDMFLN
jgi:lysyl-tRNA synthetase class 2